MSSPEYTLRPFARADAPAVVELLNAAGHQTLGFRRAAVDGVGSVRLSRYVPASAERVVAVSQGGEVAGYAYLASSERGVIHETGGGVHPARWGRGVGTLLAEWAVTRATKGAEGAPPGVRAVLQVNLFEREREAIRLFENAGFTRLREWVHMAIEFGEPPPAPALPEALVLRSMDLDADWEIVGPAMDAAFADHWGALSLAPGEEAAGGPEPGATAEAEAGEEEEPEDDSYSNAPGFCFIALDGALVAGGVLCNARLVERDDSGRVGSVFVRPEYRRSGVGRALMHAAFGAFWERGVRRIILDTDTRSFTAAPRFYERLGMRPYRRELLFEREVRAGREARRLEGG
jgi:mycothiol synthase